MKKNFTAILDSVTAKLRLQAEIAGHALSGIGSDLKELISMGEKKMEALIDRVVEEQTIRKMARSFYNNARKGKTEAVASLKKEYAAYQNKLDELVETKKEVVGFWDGFVSIFLTTPAGRSRSTIYRTHVKYGKVIGGATALFLFLPARGIGALIGSLPIVVRGAQYLQKKVQAAKEKVDGTQKKPRKASRTRTS
ncbi:MAG: hypothetical protein C0404_11260 [Verrucomicrobia bacterium]|nr:hypothetical protein [Verrucomicrobiota bacterium]